MLNVNVLKPALISVKVSLIYIWMRRNVCFVARKHSTGLCRMCSNLTVSKSRDSLFLNLKIKLRFCQLLSLHPFLSSLRQKAIKTYEMDMRPFYNFCTNFRTPQILHSRVPLISRTLSKDFFPKLSFEMSLVWWYIGIITLKLGNYWVRGGCLDF